MIFTCPIAFGLLNGRQEQRAERTYSLCLLAATNFQRMVIPAGSTDMPGLNFGYINRCFLIMVRINLGPTRCLLERS